MRNLKSAFHYVPHVLSVFILAGALIAGLSLVQQPQDIREKAAPATSLSFSPSTQTVVIGQSFTTTVVMNTSTNTVTGVDIVVTYNPSAITIASIAKGSGISNFDQTIRNNIDNTAGKITYSAYVLDKTKGVIGSGITVLTISGQVKPTATMGSYTLAFTPETAIAASGESDNALVNKTDTSISATVPTPTSTPTPSPTKTPTPTATNTPTPTKTPTPTVTNTPIPTATNTPSPTPLPKVGDVNRDGIVNITDIGLIIDVYGTQPAADVRCDLNNDGRVNIVDIGIVIDNYGL